MLKIGFSRDIHRLTTGKRLILGGLAIKSPYESVAHSDGDVLLHAISEALLGALALGDLGKHFPDTADAYKDYDSQKILKQVYAMIKEKGYAINNLDTMVFLESPKLAPHIDAMRKNIAAILEISIDQVSIKATTGEGVDSIGNHESIQAEAIVLLSPGPTIKKL